MREPKKRDLKPLAAHDVAIPFNVCSAKTFQTTKGIKKTGRTVYEHCHIVAEVAKELVARLPKVLAQKLFPKGFELVAGVHDVGKISPTFQKKILLNTHDYQPDSYPALKNVNSQLESNWGGHAGASQITLDALNPGKYIPEIVGQHHGFSPSTGLMTAEGKVLGGDAWQKERIFLLAELKKQLGTDWPEIGYPEQASLLAGLTSVADWIGSGEYFEDPEKPWQNQINAALNNAGFIPPVIRKGLDFKQIFGFDPYDVQEKLFMNVKNPGLYVLEAPMGQGKTEAALYAAYHLLSERKASGIYFALPTQLTSNKIYDRFTKFLDCILEPDFIHRRALLLHGAAWLLEGSDMGEEGQPGGEWFNSPKRGLLAPFAVGTIDQALMAAMNVKHGFVRAFGLAGKVVILDEVHSYDIYTGTILNALIKLLKNFGCTVIILSATLSRGRKQKLLESKLEKEAYPLITVKEIDAQPDEIPVTIHSTNRISLLFQDNESVAVETALKKAAEGQQVLWVENSVDEAQKCYLALAARASELDVACGLLHSRFTPEHRLENENHWVRQFGKSGWKTRGQKGRLLIGTQVLEQSLDIDADFLITRFCPTDMLFQRLGRLWRHDETPRHPKAKRSALLIAPNPMLIKNNPKSAFGTSGYVYSPYVLHRSYGVWRDCREINLPEDIRPFIESTYAKRNDHGFMAELLNELEMGTRYRKGKIALEQLARITLSRDGKTLPETKAQTRYSEMETLEVLLVKDIIPIPDKMETRIDLLSGESLNLPWNSNRLNKKEWKKMAVKLMNQTVKTSHKSAPLPVPKEWLEKIGLGNCLYLGQKEYDESMLRLAIVDETCTLRGFTGATLNENFILQYRQDLGYRSIRQEE